MDAQTIHDELSRLAAQRAMLEAEAQPHAEARARALASETFNGFRQSEVDQANFHLERIERELSAKDQRAAALRSALPSEALIASATDQAARISEDLAATRKLLALRVAALSKTCAGVVDGVRATAVAKATADELQSKLLGLKSQFGITIPAPASNLGEAPLLLLRTATLLLQVVDGRVDARGLAEASQLSSEAVKA